MEPNQQRQNVSNVRGQGKKAMHATGTSHEKLCYKQNDEQQFTRAAVGKTVRGGVGSGRSVSKIRRLGIGRSHE